MLLTAKEINKLLLKNHFLRPYGSQAVPEHMLILLNLRAKIKLVNIKPGIVLVRAMNMVVTTKVLIDNNHGERNYSY